MQQQRAEMRKDAEMKKREDEVSERKRGEIEWREREER
jgi:hypothetical protein